jgi:outer membrane protein assembly factor BamB
MVIRRTAFRATAGLVLLLAAMPALAADRGGAGWWTGYRGDGSGVHRESHPPTEFDEKTGKNVLWKVPMPEWGHGCPTAARGRVLLMCEPGRESDWPVLLCLDEKDGRLLWRKEINHLSELIKDEADRREIERTWHEMLAKYRTAYKLFNGWFYAQEDAKEGWEEKFEEQGLVFNGWSGGGYGQLRRMKFKDPAAHAANLKTLARGGLSLETWYHGCGLGTSCVGQAFAAPLCDGQLVYVATGLHSYACLDMDGKLLWLKSVRGDGSQGGNDYCKNARQPLLYSDLFISDSGALVRAMDRKTGELRWSAWLRDQPQKGKGKVAIPHLSILSPMIIQAGEKDILLCGGGGKTATGTDDDETGGSLRAFLLPGGEPLPVEGWCNPGLWAVVKYDEPDVVFFTGGGQHGGWSENDLYGDHPSPAAVKFSLAGGKLAGKLLWCGIEGKSSRHQASIVYHEGKVYMPDGVILDAQSGKILAGSKDERGNPAARATPATRHLIEIAGGHVYGLREGRGSETKPPQDAVFEVYSLDGKKVSENRLSNAPVEGEKQRQVIETQGWNTWHFSYACPFTIAADRIYVRSYDYLWCIGRKGDTRRGVEP